jgi:hypothetical protein
MILAASVAVRATPLPAKPRISHLARRKIELILFEELVRDIFFA